MRSRAGVAVLLMTPANTPQSPNTHAKSVLDALILAEDYLAGLAIFAADREPGLAVTVERGPYPRAYWIIDDAT